MSTIKLSPCPSCEKFMKCKLIVKDELRKLGLHDIFIDLGSMEIREDISHEQKEMLKKVFMGSCIKRMPEKDDDFIEKIENVIIGLVNSDNVFIMHSAYISKKLNHSYNFIAYHFMKAKGITIQQYIINLRIERVKEYLLHDDLTITEISYKLNYSSVAHLSKQFHNVTGMSPSEFRQQKYNHHLLYKESIEPYGQQMKAIN